jgi:hypothetical protein
MKQYEGRILDERHRGEVYRKESQDMKKNEGKKTHWQVHPIALLFSRKTPEERAEMKQDMLERVARGLDPLENRLLLYEGQLLDGRHRDEIWMELAEEKGGFFARNRPPTETFQPAKHGIGSKRRRTICSTCSPRALRSSTRSRRRPRKRAWRGARWSGPRKFSA